MYRTRLVAGVLVILAVLASAFLFPALDQAREARERARLLSNLRHGHEVPHPAVDVTVNEDYLITSVSICPRCYEAKRGRTRFFKPKKDGDGTLEEFRPWGALLDDAQAKIQQQLANQDYIEHYPLPEMPDD